MSKRLGGINKALLKIGDKSVIERVVYALSSVTEEIILVTNSPDEFKHLNLHIYSDILPKSGPLGGIYTGLQKSRTYLNLVVACDMPFVQSHLLAFLISQSEGYDIVIPMTPDGYHPLCAIYSKKCINPIESLVESGNLKVTNLFPYVNVNKVDFAALNSIYDLNMFFNINTSEDYLNALSIANQSEKA